MKESLKESFKKKVLRRKFLKVLRLLRRTYLSQKVFLLESVVGYGTKVSKMFFFIEYIVVRESFEAS